MSRKYHASILEPFPEKDSEDTISLTKQNVALKRRKPIL